MFYYSPSSRFQGYTSYLPRRSYLPTSFDVDDTPSSAFALEDLGHSSLPQSFLPPGITAETRYRRALYELEAAEQEYQAHVAVERARQAAAVRRRVAAEAARREHEIALYAEMERINRARALQEQVEEGFFQRQPPSELRPGWTESIAIGPGVSSLTLCMAMPREILLLASLRVTPLILVLILSLLHVTRVEPRLLVTFGPIRRSPT